MVFIVFVLIVVIVVFMNVMLFVFNFCCGEIGMCKVFGVWSWQIGGFIILELVGIGIVGGVVGLVFGMGVIFVVMIMQ